MLQRLLRLNELFPHEERKTLFQCGRGDPWEIFLFAITQPCADSDTARAYWHNLMAHLMDVDIWSLDFVLGFVNGALYIAPSHARESDGGPLSAASWGSPQGESMEARIPERRRLRSIRARKKGKEGTREDDRRQDDSAASGRAP
jgi:hypothetical protein